MESTILIFVLIGYDIYKPNPTLEVIIASLGISKLLLILIECLYYIYQKCRQQVVDRTYNHI